MTRLRELVDQPAVVVEDHEALALVARRMFDQHVGSVIVFAVDGSLEGIFTERDLLRACAAGVDTHTATVGRWMSGGVVTAHATEEVETALQRMLDHHIRHLPVLGQEGLIGVVSMGQLSRRLHRVHSA